MIISRHQSRARAILEKHYETSDLIEETKPEELQIGNPSEQEKSPHDSYEGRRQAIRDLSQACELDIYRLRKALKEFF